MNNILQMALAFLILYAVAIFFCTSIKTNIGEGMFLAVSFVIVCLFFSSFAGTFIYGMYGIYLIAIVGGLFYCGISIYHRQLKLGFVFSISAIVLVLLYFGSLLIYHNDFIQHIDEFHEWAAAVRYMLVHDKMPTGYDFIGGGGQYGFATSLFHLFFQKIAGYSEQNMYVSAALLSWIGFMLPFAGYKWNNWKKPMLYAVIVYIALFSLYMYGSKSLYVDIPVAAWAGGLAGWWINREKKKTNILVLLSGLIMLHFFKQSAGLLMAVFVLLFVLFQSFVIEKGFLNKENGMKKLKIFTGILCLAVLVGSGVLLLFSVKIKPVADVQNELTQTQENAVQEQRWEIAGIELPEKLSTTINVVKLSKEKAVLSFGAFMTSAFGTPLSSRSNWNLAFLPFAFFLVILMKLSGELYEEKKACTGYALYAGFVVLSYGAALFFSYLFMFAYELSVNMRSVSRYFSICSIYLFIIAMTVLLQEKKAQREKICEYTTYGILFFFALGLNTKYIPNATALQKTEISGYDKISSTKKQIRKIEEVIADTDKVYFIHQYASDSLGGAELVNAPALYYMDDQISNYLGMPWRFTEDGCNIRLENFDTLSLQDLPNLLSGNGYTYVWIYAKDDYLTEMLPQVMACDQVKSKSLYQVKYENGAAVGLEYVCSL